MSIDGVFIHYLVDELQTIVNNKINKVMKINDTDFIFVLPRKQKLLISVDSNHPHLRLTKFEAINSSQISNFFNSLKKYFENNYITNISQYHNDRIIEITTTHYDELGFEKNITLIIEAMGRNANLIITDENKIIIDCYKKTALLDDKSNRIITNKVVYTYPQSSKINPFDASNLASENIYEGVSTLLFNELKAKQTLQVIYQPKSPTIIKTTNKNFFYCFDLTYMEGNRLRFETISEMLDAFYLDQNSLSIKNNEQKLIENYLKREIQKLSNKLCKQEVEYSEALKNLKLEKIGNILSSNLYQVRQGMSTITLFNYYDNEDITISLDPLLNPSDNLSAIFGKYKKSKRAIGFLQNQIELTKKDIEYYNSILEQLDLGKNLDIKEIIEELNLTKRAKQAKTAKRSKPNITIYNDIYGGSILVGKNNIQNNYLTHTIANKDDLFFHVKSIGGSHVILRSTFKDDRSIQLAADIAAYYSKYRTSVNANVDMTKVKNVKKVPGTKGSFVTYNTYSTIFANPNYDLIKSQIKS